MAYTKYSLTPSSNTAAPPDGAPEGMLPSAVNDTMRDMMSQIRDCGDGIRGGTYTMTAPVITGGSINGTTTITTSGAISYTGTLTGGTGVVNLGSGQFYKTSGGLVGIGSVAPVSKLQVDGTSPINGVNATYVGSVQINESVASAQAVGGLEFKSASFGSGYGWKIASLDSSGAQLTFNTRQNSATWSESMRIDSSGNVGIGVSSISYKLQVNGTGSSTSLFKSTNATSTTPFANIITGFSSASAGADTTLLLTDATLYNSYIGAGGGSLYFATNGTTERMRIDSTGAVGIGTSTVGTKFDVLGSGTILSGTTYATSQVIQDGATKRGLYFGYDTSGQIGVIAGNTGAAASQIAFWRYTGSAWAESMRIDSSGNLLVGTTTAQLGRVSSAGISGEYSFSSAPASNGGEYYHMLFRSSGTQSGLIFSPTASTTSYVTTSDYRLKENIVPMTGALAKVCALKPVTYRWIADGIDSQGFIAHELQAVVPECVVGEKNAVNEDGSIKPQGIDTSFLVATLTAAIQEQQAMINELKAKVAALEAA